MLIGRNCASNYFIIYWRFDIMKEEEKLNCSCPRCKGEFFDHQDAGVSNTPICSDCFIEIYKTMSKEEQNKELTKYYDANYGVQYVKEV